MKATPRESIRAAVRELNRYGISESISVIPAFGKSGHMQKITFSVNGKTRSVYMSASGDWRAIKNNVARIRQVCRAVM